MYEDVRWKQRFQHFEKAYIVFERRIRDYRENPTSEANRMSLVQAFEVLMELAWKMLKDFLLSEGIEVNSPKEVIRQAFHFQMISNGQVWMDALSKRNLTTHTYDEAMFTEILEFINGSFHEIVAKLFEDFKKRYEE